jgi:hypothetical protein
MAEKKARLPRITSPKGVAKYPWLKNPDTQFNTDGIYKINLLIPAAEAVELCKTLDVAADEAFVKAKTEAKSPAIAKLITRRAPYASELDDAGEETGNIEFKFKMNAKVKMKDGSYKTMKPFIFDSKGQQMQVCPNVYGGSVCRVNFCASPYYAASNKEAGVSLRMNAVQIVTLVSGGGGDAKSMGFNAEEGGFEADSFDGGGASTEAGGAAEY